MDGRRNPESGSVPIEDRKQMLKEGTPQSELWLLKKSPDVDEGQVIPREDQLLKNPERGFEPIEDSHLEPSQTKRPNKDDARHIWDR